MSTVNGFQVGSETLKYNYESLDNYNTPNFSTSSSTTYAVGDYVMYNGKLYKCTTATTGGTWISGSWNEVVLSDDVSDLTRQLSDVEDALTDTYRFRDLDMSLINMTKGKYIYTDGGLVNNSDCWYSELIPVVQGEKFIYRLAFSSSGLLIAGYETENWRTLVSGSTVQGAGYGTAVTGEYVVPQGVNYLRVATLIWDDHTVSDISNRVQGIFFESADKIKEYPAVLSLDDLFFRSGWAVRANNGNIVSMPNYAYVTPDYIPVKYGQSIIYSAFNNDACAIIAVYDKYKNFLRCAIKGVGGEEAYRRSGSVDIQDGECYVRFSFYKYDGTNITLKIVTKEEASLNRLSTEDAIMSVINDIDGDSITWTAGFIDKYGDKSSNGYEGSDYVPVLPGMQIDYKLSCSANFAVIAAYDEYKSFVSCPVEGSGYSAAKTGTYVVPEGIKYLRFSRCPVSSLPGRYVRAYIPVLEKYKPRQRILLDNADAIERIRNARRITRNTTPTTGAFSLLHFTDIHGTADALERIIEFKTAVSDMIEDAVCTGDMVVGNSGNGMAFWNGVSGSENVLMTVGNHDVYDSSDALLTLTQQYDLYFKPYISNWNVVSTENKTYWYKDYSTQKIRLIGLGTTATNTQRAADDAEQLSWFDSLLTDAIEKGLSIIVAQHYLPADGIGIASNFMTITGSGYGNMSIKEDYLTAIDTFIANGGKFICHLCGHVHNDYLVYSEGHPRQIFIACGTASSNTQQQQFSDQTRLAGTKSEDTFNVVTVDTTRTLLKIVRVGANVDMLLRDRNAICLNYTTKEVISQA